MESHTKAFGHPIHPMLIVFPLGLLATSVIFDIIDYALGQTTFATVTYYTIAAGIIGGLLAAVFGLVDWLAIPAGTRAKRLGALHGVGNVTVVAIFFVSWLLRNTAPGYAPGTLAFILGLLAVGLALFTAWLGGEMVYRLGMAVDPGANLDAPSSLSGEPAGARTDRH